MTSSTFTIQPWDPSPSTPSTLGDVLSRAQRGHLRDITESTLQEELAAEGALDLSSDNEESESESEEDEESDAKTVPFGKPSTREDLYAAKRYLLQTVDAARGEIAYAVDLTSLLVSKDLPRQAQATLGQEILQKKIPFGSVGVDFWQRMPVDERRDAQDRLLATNVKMEGLQKAADGLLGAAERMKETVRREGEYWEQVLRVSERGWKVCRVPGQGYRLGVRYGFSESARQFERKGIAALNPDRDGGISIDRGIGRQMKGLRVEVRRQGRVLGASKVLNVAEGEETTLEARIRHARDSLFDEELYHEMIRESRVMAALGVTVEGSTIKLRNPNAENDTTATSSGKDDKEISFDLIPLDSATSSFPTEPTTSSQDDRLAQAALLTARLLLIQAHRDRLRKRSELPAPLSDKQDDDTKPPLPILRPIMMVILHRSALERVNEYIGTIDGALAAAKIEHDVEHASLSPPKGEQAMTAEKLIAGALLQPLTSKATLTLHPPSQTPDLPSSEGEPSQTITLAIETSLAHSFGPTYHLTLPKTKPSPSNESQGETFHFQDPSTFAAAGDAALASTLASSVLRLAQAESHEQDWVLRADEAVVERDVGIGEQSEGFSVEVDGSEGELRLGYEGKEGRAVVWKAADDDGSGGKEKEKEGFFEVVRRCLG